MCNQAAGFNRFLTKVQESIMAQLRLIQDVKTKGKSWAKIQGVPEELSYLMNFNQSISFAMAKMMQHLSDFVCVSMANISLATRDAYMDHLRSGIKQETLAALMNTPMRLANLFLHSVIRKAEDKIISV